MRSIREMNVPPFNYRQWQTPDTQYTHVQERICLFHFSSDGAYLRKFDFVDYFRNIRNISCARFCLIIITQWCHLLLFTPHTSVDRFWKSLTSCAKHIIIFMEFIYLFLAGKNSYQLPWDYYTAISPTMVIIIMNTLACNSARFFDFNLVWAWFIPIHWTSASAVSSENVGCIMHINGI